MNWKQLCPQVPLLPLLVQYSELKLRFSFFLFVVFFLGQCWKDVESILLFFQISGHLLVFRRVVVKTAKTLATSEHGSKAT